MQEDMPQSEGGNGRRPSRGAPLASPSGPAGPSRPAGLRPLGPFSPRLAAWRALNDTTSDHPDASDNLDRRIDRPNVSDADRRLATQLVMGVLRHRSRLDFCLAKVLDKPLARQREPLLNILRIGAFQILLLDHPPDHAIVNETVEAVRHSEMRDAAGFVNGVLRNFLRRRDELSSPPRTGDPDQDFCVEHSCPQWAHAMLDEAYPGGAWRRWWIAAQQIPALHLRVNTLKTDRDALMAELRAAGLEPLPTPVPDCVAVAGAHRPGGLPCVEEGRAVPQDAAAAMVSHLLAPKPGERIVDFCAAPGGKAAHIAALAANKAEILATDVSKPRLDEIPKAMRRLGAAKVRYALATQILLAQFGNWADAVLVDAPCTGMGTIRRHPEIRWLRDREDVIQASLKQLMILGLAQQLVRPGGRLVYSTCTLFHEENQRLIETFLYHHRNFTLLDARKTAPDFLRPYLSENGILFTPLAAAPLATTPHAVSGVAEISLPIDGFFAAVLRKA